MGGRACNEVVDKADPQWEEIKPDEAGEEPAMSLMIVGANMTMMMQK